MKSTRETYRQQFSASYIRLKDWYTPERFSYIWQKAKFDYWVEGSKSPARDFVWDIGVSRRTISRWLNGVAPSQMALMRLDLALRALWGDEWMHEIDEIMEEDNDDTRDRESG